MAPTPFFYKLSTNLAESCSGKGIRNFNLMVFISRIFKFYVEGFKSMTWGKTLWLVIFIKAFIMFAVLKAFFFPNFLNTEFETDEQRAVHVLDEITTIK